MINPQESVASSESPNYFSEDKRAYFSIGAILKDANIDHPPIRIPFPLCVSSGIKQIGEELYATAETLQRIADLTAISKEAANVLRDFCDKCEYGNPYDKKPDKICGYKTSRDYDLLLKLMKYQSVVCIIGNGKNDQVDIVHTRYDNDTRESGQSGFEYFGWNGYLLVISDDAFIFECKKRNVEFIVPNLPL